MKLSTLCFSLLALPLAVSCATDDVPQTSPLNAELSPKNVWDGKTFPTSEVCAKHGGFAKSPSFLIHSAPQGTNVILVSFNNDSVDGMDKGGLGTIGYIYEPNKNGEPVLLNSVKAGEVKLPKGVFLEKPHRYTEAAPSAYYAPCKPAKGQEKYSVTLTAAKRSGTFANQTTEVLEEITLPLGKLGQYEPSLFVFEED